MPVEKHAHLAQSLLAWYDAHRRSLPWRPLSPSGDPLAPNPYHVYLSEIMLQQTTVTTVIPYFTTFTTLWPTIEALAHADRQAILTAWQGLGYYSRAHRLHDAAIIIAEQFHGAMPRTYNDLLSLPGVGPYTAGAIGAMAFNLPLPVMDGNVERLMGRLYAIRGTKSELRHQVMNILPHWPLQHRPGDIAQGMMDFANAVCLPRTPLCGQCPFRKVCSAYENDCVAEIPQRVVRAKPTRYGAFYWVVEPAVDDAAEDGPHVVLYQRPMEGLLPGMTCLPTAAWTTEPNAPPLPVLAHISHIFTHFRLEATLFQATGADIEPLGLNLKRVPLTQLSAHPLPALVRKLIRATALL